MDWVTSVSPAKVRKASANIFHSLRWNLSLSKNCALPPLSGMRGVEQIIHDLFALHYGFGCIGQSHFVTSSFMTWRASSIGNLGRSGAKLKSLSSAGRRNL
jgi:hypothetical protein